MRLLPKVLVASLPPYTVVDVPHLTHLQVMRRLFGRGMDGVIANEGAM